MLWLPWHWTGVKFQIDFLRKTVINTNALRCLEAIRCIHMSVSCQHDQWRSWLYSLHRYNLASNKSGRSEWQRQVLLLDTIAVWGWRDERQLHTFSSFPCTPSRKGAWLLRKLLIKEWDFQSVLHWGNGSPVQWYQTKNMIWKFRFSLLCLCSRMCCRTVW